MVGVFLQHQGLGNTNQHPIVSGSALNRFRNPHRGWGRLEAPGDWGSRAPFTLRVDGAGRKHQEMKNVTMEPRKRLPKEDGAPSADGIGGIDGINGGTLGDLAEAGAPRDEAGGLRAVGAPHRGIRLWHTIRGEAPPVVMSLGATPSGWALGPMEPLGFRFVCLGVFKKNESRK